MPALSAHAKHVYLSFCNYIAKIFKIQFNKTNYWIDFKYYGNIIMISNIHMHSMSHEADNIGGLKTTHLPLH